jgi:hypothetical protein
MSLAKKKTFEESVATDFTVLRCLMFFDKMLKNKQKNFTIRRKKRKVCI